MIVYCVRRDIFTDGSVTHEANGAPSVDANGRPSPDRHGRHVGLSAVFPGSRGGIALDRAEKVEWIGVETDAARSRLRPVRDDPLERASGEDLLRGSGLVATETAACRDRGAVGRGTFRFSFSPRSQPPRDIGGLR